MNTNKTEMTMDFKWKLYAYKNSLQFGDVLEIMCDWIRINCVEKYTCKTN